MSDELKPGETLHVHEIRFGDVPVRVDATLCDRDEIWLEGPTGEAVRVWPPPLPEKVEP